MTKPKPKHTSNRVGTVWTKADDEQLRTLAAAGRSKRDIALILKRTPIGVGTRAGALHVPLKRSPTSWGRPFSADDDQALRDMVAAGVRRYTCARRMQRGAEAIIKRAAELGTPFPPIDRNHVWKRCLEAATAEWMGGASGAEIARRHGGGLTRAAVIAKMHRQGLGNVPGRYKPRKKPKPAKQCRPRKPRPVAAVRTRPTMSSVFVWSYKRGASSLKPLPPTVRSEDVARISHDDLTSKHCRWPVGDVHNAISNHRPLFCGKRREPGLPYCAEHVHCAYTAITLIPRQHYPADTTKMSPPTGGVAGSEDGAHKKLEGI